ncbi:hypothetical protein C8R42DRAFT_640289 [Lentinula raphanica]|nr:hypothetical protein C8R42DRAFT_640289 [Lentinula raphanica]
MEGQLERVTVIEWRVQRGRGLTKQVEKDNHDLRFVWTMGDGLEWSSTRNLRRSRAIDTPLYANVTSKARTFRIFFPELFQLVLVSDKYRGSQEDDGKKPGEEQERGVDWDSRAREEGANVDLFARYEVQKPQPLKRTSLNGTAKTSTQRFNVNCLPWVSTLRSFISSLNNGNSNSILVSSTEHQYLTAQVQRQQPHMSSVSGASGLSTSLIDRNRLGVIDIATLILDEINGRGFSFRYHEQSSYSTNDPSMGQTEGCRKEQRELEDETGWILQKEE